jgi:hypothetical protein
LVGVDFGRDRDRTAIAVAEICEKEAAPYKEIKRGIVEERTDMIAKYLSFVHLEQAEVRTSYTEIIRRINEILSNPHLIKRVELIVDATGIGAPLFDMLKAHGLSPIGVTITSGEHENPSQMGFRVPKLTLVDSIQVLLHTQRLAMSDKVPEPLRAEFFNQMSEFVMKTRESGHQSFEARLERIHDDLVIAFGLCCWHFVKRNGQSLTRPPAGDTTKKTERYNPIRRGKVWQRS